MLRLYFSSLIILNRRKMRSNLYRRGRRVSFSSFEYFRESFVFVFLVVVLWSILRAAPPKGNCASKNRRVLFEAV